jgi:dimethylaniline monooxygenase (N-oxide forming)
LSGLVTAARYLQRHPDCDLAILEQDDCVGGVWSKKRNYSTFWTQWTYGIAEFADFAMERPPAEDMKQDLFKSKHTTKYLEDYADHIRIAGRSVRDRIQFNVKIGSVDKKDRRWRLACSDRDGNNSRIVTAARVMMANGQASVPRMPDLPGHDLFSGKIIHSLNYGESNVIEDPTVLHVAVFGGGKSAADMVYEAVKAGKTVSWVIRKTGDGSTVPGFFAPPDVPTPYQNVGFAAQTRLMSSLQPSFINKDTWWTWFLHRTSYGVRLVKWIFDSADKGIRKRAAYHERKSTKGFEKLQYETPSVQRLLPWYWTCADDSRLFWQNGVGGVLHHADFYPLVAEKVDVYRAKVKRLQGNELYLDDEVGTHFPCDAILCGTGWQRGLDIFSDELKVQLGLPYPKELDSISSKETAKWEQLVADADKNIYNRFHILRSPPPHPHIEESRTPYKLYHGIAPLHDNTILFMNHVVLSNKLLCAEVQAMWAVAHFDGNIKVPPDVKERNIATWIAWCRRRYLSNGGLGNVASFDGIPYVDNLLEEMGLSAHRKKGWLRDFFAPVLPADLGKAWAEYLQKNPAGLR